MDEGLLLPFQQVWLQDTSPVKVYEKSRQIGVSWTTAAEAVLLAAATKGCDVWYVGYNKDLALEFLRHVTAWAELFNAAASEMGEEMIEDEDGDILAYTVRFASGFRVSGLTSRPRNFRGKTGYAIIDEAAFHEGLSELIKAAIAFLVWGGRVAIISTHDGVDNEFNQLVEAIRAGKRSFSLHRTTLDDALEEGLFKRIALVTGQEWSEERQRLWRAALMEAYGDGADEELFCTPHRVGLTYLSRDLIESRMHTVPIVRLELPESFIKKDEKERIKEIDQWCATHLRLPLARLKTTKQATHYFGMDFGRTSDLSVIAPMVLPTDLVRRCPFLVEMRNVPFEQQKQVLFYVIRGLPRFGGGHMDATGNGAWLAEKTALQFGRSIIEEVKITRPWYAERMPFFKAAFEDGTIEVPRDADVLQDLLAFRTMKGIPMLPDAKTGKKGKPRHADAAIALVLGHAACGGGIRKYDYESARESTWPSRKGGLY